MKCQLWPEITHVGIKIEKLSEIRELLFKVLLLLLALLCLLQPTCLHTKSLRVEAHPVNDPGVPDLESSTLDKARIFPDSHRQRYRYPATKHLPRGVFPERLPDRKLSPIRHFDRSDPRCGRRYNRVN